MGPPAPWLSGKEAAYHAGDASDVGLIPGLRRSSGGGGSNPLQYSCFGNSMDRGALVAYSPGGCKEFHELEHTHTHTLSHTHTHTHSHAPPAPWDCLRGFHWPVSEIALWTRKGIQVGLSVRYSMYGLSPCPYKEIQGKQYMRLKKYRLILKISCTRYFIYF